MAGSRTASKTAYPLPPDQDQRDRQEVRAHDLHPGLVRAAVVQERAPEPADSARSAGRPATSSCPPRHGASVNLVLVSSTLTDLDSSLRRAQNSF